jgi:hypothetical protein
MSTSIRIVAALLASLGLLLAALTWGQSEHPHFWWEKVPGFAAALGFAGCWLLIAVSKALGKHWLERHEGYYDD